MAQSKGRDFYEGELAEKIAAFATECGAALTLDDLRNYQPEWVEPISKDYHGYTLHEIPPNGQGIAALIALGIAERFDLRNVPVDSIRSQHIQIEAMTLSFADVYRYVSDPSSMPVTPLQILAYNYMASSAQLIKTRKRAGRE